MVVLARSVRFLGVDTVHLKSDLGSCPDKPDYLRIAFYMAHRHELGPGDRFIIWVQGCKKRCPGCTAPEHQPMDGGTVVSIDEMSEIIKDSGCNLLTISGGEPLLQWKSLSKLLKRLDTFYVGKTILYTGYSVVDDVVPLMEDDESFRRFVLSVGFIIDGEYIEELNDGKGLRGSTNQRLYAIMDGILVQHISKDVWRTLDGLTVHAPDSFEFESSNRQCTMEFSMDGTVTEVGVPDRATDLMMKALKHGKLDSS